MADDAELKDAMEWVEFIAETGGEEDRLLTMASAMSKVIMDLKARVEALEAERRG